MDWALAALLTGVLLMAAPQRGGDAVLPQGSQSPIHFLYPITSGRDTVGSPVVVQTMGALVRHACMVVPPFTQVRGRVSVSRSGRRFGEPAGIDIRFDSLEVRWGSWAAMSAVLDSLEYVSPRDVTLSGTVVGERVSLGQRLLPVALAERPAITGPVSTEYFKGREQDAAYELPGPNARIRHHVRIWVLDSLSGLWVGAATQDVGISTTSDGQEMVSDGRAAVVRVRDCAPGDMDGS